MTKRDKQADATVVPSTGDQPASRTPANAIFSDDSRSAREKVGDYPIIRELGRGSFGVVYLARDQVLQRDVAIKVPIGNVRKRAAYIREARKAASVEGQGIVTIYHVGELEDGTPMVIQKYIAGTTLADVIRSGQQILPSQAVRLLRDMSRAISIAHSSGIFHRDLKPANVLIDERGDPWIADFGLALDEEEQGSHSGEVAGTLAYMSPEQIGGHADWLDGRSDIWSLGVIFYEMISGKRPFKSTQARALAKEIQQREPTPLHQRMRHLPREMNNIFRGCCQKQAVDRYATADELVEELDVLLQDKSLLESADAVVVNSSGSVVTELGTSSTIQSASTKDEKASVARSVSISHAASGLVGSVFALSVLCVLMLALQPWGWFKKSEPLQSGNRDAVKETWTRADNLRLQKEIRTILSINVDPTRERPKNSRPASSLGFADYSNFEILSDDRYWDLRGWNDLTESPESECFVVLRRRVRVLKVGDADEIRFEAKTDGEELFIESLSHPDDSYEVVASDPAFVGDRKTKARHLVVNVGETPVGGEFTVEYKASYWNSLQDPSDHWLGAIGYPRADRLRMYVVMPDDRPYKSYRLQVAPSFREESREYDGPRRILESEDRQSLLWEVPTPTGNWVYTVILDW